jgi:hypothetical protein
MRKMRLDLDELVVEAFPTTSGAQAARGTVRGHSGLPGCEPAAGDDFGVEPLSQFDINSNTGGRDHCICPREVASADAPC